MPVLLHRNINFVLRDAIDEAYPFSIVPILVTNAELFVAHEDFGLEKLGATQNFEELCSKADCVKIHVSLPASFANHCHNIFSDFTKEI